MRGKKRRERDLGLQKRRRMNGEDAAEAKFTTESGEDGNWEIKGMRKKRWRKKC